VPTFRSGQLVRICTPLVQDQQGNFLPSARAAIDSGAMRQHFSQVDAVVNAMKRDRRSALNTALADGRSHALLTVSGFQDPRKTVSVTRVATSAGLSCRPGYRTATYQAAEWLRYPNLSPREATLLP